MIELFLVLTESLTLMAFELLLLVTDLSFLFSSIYFWV